MKKIFNFSLLKTQIKTHNAKIDYKIYKDQKLIRETVIEGICCCGQNFKKTFRQLIRKGGPYCKHCTMKNRSNKTEQTCLVKYGETSHFKNKDIQNKREKTWLMKYGVKNPMQNKQVQKNLENSCLIKYGKKYSTQDKDVQQKRKHTCLIKYGTEHPIKNKDVQNKYKETSLLRYGKNHPMQNSEISEKSLKNSYRIKNITLPSGKNIILQGYEPQALQYLLNQFTEDEIISERTNVPEIWYTGEDGNQHRYYTDFYIPKINMCIEVKSRRTFELEKEKTLLKQKATIDAGFNCEIWIINQKGIILEYIFYM